MQSLPHIEAARDAANATGTDDATADAGTSSKAERTARTQHPLALTVLLRLV